MESHSQVDSSFFFVWGRAEDIGSDRPAKEAPVSFCELGMISAELIQHEEKYFGTPWAKEIVNK